MAPVVLFAFRRPDHTLRTLNALSRNHLASRTELIVYSDGPKDDQDVAAVTAVRDLVQEASGFASVRVVERQRNLGLSASVIDGVTEVLRENDKVIVLEDDLLTSRYFLSYMNEALSIYEDDASVASIHGYCPPMRSEGPETFFLRGADCWGWATWRRAWSEFNPDGETLLAQLEERGLTWAFDLDGAYGYTSMLEDQIAMRNDSWAIRWHASMYLAEKYTLYPGRSLVENIGVDGSGTHGGRSKMDNCDVSAEQVNLQRIDVIEDPEIRRWYVDGVARLGGRKRRFYRRLSRILR
jgi:glycosyltransferase involved in cell wall biosynthesis